MVDQKKIEQAVRLLLEGIGEDPSREGLIDTPKRIARMYEEIFGGMDETAREHLAKQFAVDEVMESEEAVDRLTAAERDGGSQDKAMVLEKDITFYSMCEHHLLPFYGKAHVAYIPDGSVVGLSKLARTVEVFARRPQIQERLTAQIADAIMEELHPKGVMVMLEAEHMCMTMRGVKKPGSQTVTTAMRGAFQDSAQLQTQFMTFLSR